MKLFRRASRSRWWLHLAIIAAILWIEHMFIHIPDAYLALVQLASAFVVLVALERIEFGVWLPGERTRPWNRGR